MKPGWATILLFAVLYQAWIEEVTRASVSSLVTGFILWSFTVGAVVSGLIFERWTWRRHLCPLGAWSGVFAMSSVVEVRADPGVCVDKRCSGIYCYFGRDELPEPALSSSSPLFRLLHAQSGLDGFTQHLIVAPSLDESPVDEESRGAANTLLPALGGLLFHFSLVLA